MISIMMKPASSSCNMHCTYCFYKDEASKREIKNYGMMEEDTIKNIVRRAFKKAKRAVTFAFQGGEPTLRGLDFYYKLIELEKQYNIHHLPVHHAFQTNGYLLDEKWCTFFHDHHFLVGISIDGIKATHDLYRHTSDGRPTFDYLVEKTKLLDRYQVDYNILTVVNKDVAENITEIYKEYKKRGWNYQQYIPCLDELDETRGSRDYSLIPEVYGRFLITLFKLWNKDVKKGKQPYIRMFENYIGILLGYQPESCDMNGRCGISYIIEANGDVYPCDFYMLDEYRLGNINNDSITKIDERRKEISFIERSSQLSIQCKECQYYRICRGGCQRHRDLEINQTYKNYFCESYQMFFNECLEDMIQIVKKIPKR